MHGMENGRRTLRVSVVVELKRSIFHALKLKTYHVEAGKAFLFGNNNSSLKNSYTIIDAVYYHRAFYIDL